jgi:hypothetical protein
MWIGFIWFGTEPVARSCAYGNERSDPIRGMEIFLTK